MVITKLLQLWLHCWAGYMIPLSTASHFPYFYKNYNILSFDVKINLAINII